MRIEGTITTIYETWPPQLAVETAAGRYHVALSAETHITQHQESIAMQDLRSGLNVAITGDETGQNALRATSIELLG